MAGLLLLATRQEPAEPLYEYAVLQSQFRVGAKAEREQRHQLDGGPAGAPDIHSRGGPAIKPTAVFVPSGYTQSPYPILY